MTATGAVAGIPDSGRCDRAVARRITQLSPGRLRVAVDGLTRVGKTSFGQELAATLGALGRPTMRASLDDFKYPWRHTREHGYDPGRKVALCGHDPPTGEDHREQGNQRPACTSAVTAF